MPTAWWRRRRTSCERRGRLSQRRIRRAPIGVTVSSSTPSRVCSVRPLGCVSSSRLRRVGGGEGGVAAGGGVQRDRFAGAFHRHAGKMRQRAFLGFFHVAEQAARGGDGERQVV